MKSSLRVLSNRTRRYLAIMVFLLIVFIIPFVLVGIMPGTSWGKAFWSNIKINDYSFYYSFYWGSVSAVANCVLLMIYATLKLMVSSIPQIANIIFLSIKRLYKAVSGHKQKSENDNCYSVPCDSHCMRYIQQVN